MSDVTLSNVDFEQYHALLRRLLPYAESVAVYGSAGDLVWSSQGAERKVLSSVASSMPGRDSAPAQTAMTSAGVQYRAPISDYSENTIAWMSVLVPNAEGKGRVYEINEALRMVSGLCSKEYQLQAEVHTMAKELGDRYEELNLVYATDDQVEGFVKGRDAMQTLVNNCTEFLDVGLSALVLPDKNIALSCVNARTPLGQVGQHIEFVNKKLSDWVGEQQRSVVVNTGDTQVREQLGLTAKVSVVACPILIGENEVIGTLAILNDSKRPDFTNNDRNLLEVMAKKTAKIVQASYDSLTGLINTHGFEWCVSQALDAVKTDNKGHCLMHLDLNNLQVINDISGRQAGDEVIRRTAMAIKAKVREQDDLARIGGDEFALLLWQCPLSKAKIIAQEVIESLKTAEFIWDGNAHRISASIGLIEVNADTESVATALSAAEVAQEMARKRGINQIQVMLPEDMQLARRREDMKWVGRIQQALKFGSFRLYAQPILPVSPDGHSAHFEVLVRLQESDGKVLPPGAFMGAAEYYQLMPAIDRWVVAETVYAMGKIWPRLGDRQLKVAINLSGQSITGSDFQAFVLETLSKTPVPAHCFCFEITESAAVENIQAAKGFINALREIGCKFSLDDFGTGLSSFSYLKEFNVDYLKIDGSFVKELADDPVSEAMVVAINQVGHVMGLKTIAEYVENDAIMAKLGTIGVDYGQGYGLGKPQPLQNYLDSIGAGTPAVGVKG